MLRSLPALFALAFLTSCGGGGGGDAEPAPTPAPAPGPVPAPAPAPAVRLKATFEPDVAGTPSPVTLTIAPTGSTIGTNAIASVQVTANGEAPVTLSQANSRDAAGRDLYVFKLPGGSTVDCGGGPVVISVTDVTGFNYTKYGSYCSTVRSDYGGFSDYGTNTVTFSGSANASGAAGTFTNVVTRDFRRVDLFPSFSWSTRTAPGESSYAELDPPVGVTGYVSLATDGGAEATSYGIGYTSISLDRTLRAQLQCCGQAATTDRTAANIDYPATAPQRQLTIFISRTSSTAGDYSYRYQIFDPGTRTVARDFSGQGTGATQIERLVVKQGQVLTVEARPRTLDPSSRVFVDVVTEREDGLQGVLAVNGSAMTNRTDASARLRIPCCYP